ncbi:DUF2058 domain-containing protein [Stenotrophomonas sp. W1S232]|uniref:DUF2058 domain-containing protein n=1 Tax=Stenotrophomonas koreensis TaxID=266128 RepID=A0A0R0BS88_9GAMM|nr:DUF2058 domain-containing protein [Stenotrophomonas koreensis]KRG59849.1 nucleoprotein/polynucleotide-associated enzyme [Stenotrophomonas koreensis]MBB1116960.1 DUF2058 domain-containing protein [Stenotrophomonas koreensis]
MAKANALQAQLLKAGLVKKSQVSQVANQQAKARVDKHDPKAAAIAAEAELARIEAEKARLEKVERDRQIAAERNAERRANELRAQARQIIADKKVLAKGEAEYRFNDGEVIRTLLLTEAVRKQVIDAALVIVRDGEGYCLLPRVAAVQVRERAPELIVLDNAGRDYVEPSTGNAEDDAYYAQFQVPDDLVW